MKKSLTPLDRLALLRKVMDELHINVFIVPTADPHLSEYVPEHWALRKALTGFTGSAGTLVASSDHAALITDSRYWEQAEKQLPPEIELVKLTKPLVDVLKTWLLSKNLKGSLIGFMPELMSAAQAEKLTDNLEASDFDVCAYPDFSIDSVWPDRPEPIKTMVHPMKRPARSSRDKVKVLREMAAAKGARAILATKLDDVAWVTNLRGSDVPYNPVFDANLIIAEKESILLIDAERLTPEAQKQLQADNIKVMPPEDLPRLLGSGKIGPYLVDPDEVNYEIFLDFVDMLVKGASPVERLKSMKSPEEIEAIKEAHLKDAVALTEFYAELDERLARKDVLTEADAADMLHAWRAKDPEFIEESFATISAYGPNAALPHYQPAKDGSAQLSGDGLLLIDSGAQYECGTTDVTRMTPIGNPSREMRRDVALATKAMLKLLHLRFPQGATGAHIDAVARMDLWAEGINFGHGTGHGVGYVLNVHEGPVTISPLAKPIPIEVGNVLSDEPGIYRPGRWGVRVENLMVCVADGETEFGKFLRFEPLTMMPIDVRMFEEPFGEGVELLNAFNAERVERLMPLVSERARNWLKRAAAPIA